MIATASDKQTGLIRSLLSERAVPAALASAIEADLAKGLTVKAASGYITALFATPRKPKTVAPAAGSPLADLPKSRYALETDALVGALTGVNVEKNDTLFIEIREYRGTVYMRRLVGAPGDFLRYRLNANDTKVIAGAIRSNPLEAAQRFGAKFTCCGKCGAPLTDEESRRIMLGPVCKGAFGL